MDVVFANLHVLHTGAGTAAASWQSHKRGLGGGHPPGGKRFPLTGHGADPPAAEAGPARPVVPGALHGRGPLAAGLSLLRRPKASPSAAWSLGGLGGVEIPKGTPRLLGKTWPHSLLSHGFLRGVPGEVPQRFMLALSHLRWQPHGDVLRPRERGDPLPALRPGGARRLRGFHLRGRLSVRCNVHGSVPGGLGQL